MHELSVTESLLKIALKHAEKANAKRVTDLNIVIGDLASMVDDSIQFYWEIIAKGTIAEQAKLNFRRVPAQLQCMTCSETYHPSDRELACPKCNGINVKIITGEEFALESIDVE
jgi:hydrogenase nickel incorporation protein HypA/HybF